MNGRFVAAVLWYIGITLVGAWVAQRYDAWIERRRERGVVPTAFLVVIGVLGTEIMRAARLLYPAWVAGEMSGAGGWRGVIAIIAAWAVDSTLAYAATGTPMILGDLRREARLREDQERIRVGIVREIAKGVADADEE
ncbi:MAG TPA: hypothetical protein EYH32_04915 [Anaerolineae bacterium]|nr:hypothetical protein [Anaerolineae bacterium]